MEIISEKLSADYRAREKTRQHDSPALVKWQLQQKPFYHPSSLKSLGNGGTRYGTWAAERARGAKAPSAKPDDRFFFFSRKPKLSLQFSENCRETR